MILFYYLASNYIKMRTFSFTKQKARSIPALNEREMDYNLQHLKGCALYCIKRTYIYRAGVKARTIVFQMDKLLRGSQTSS